MKAPLWSRPVPGLSSTSTPSTWYRSNRQHTLHEDTTSTKNHPLTPDSPPPSPVILLLQSLFMLFAFYLIPKIDGVPAFVTYTVSTAVPAVVLAAFQSGIF